MKITIERSKLDSWIKDTLVPEKACLLGQVLKQLRPALYETAPDVCGVDSAVSAGLLTEAERSVGLSYMYILSEKLKQDKNNGANTIHALLATWPEHTFEVVE